MFMLIDHTKSESIIKGRRGSEAVNLKRCCGILCGGEMFVVFVSFFKFADLGGLFSFSKYIFTLTHFCLLIVYFFKEGLINSS